MEAVNSGRLVYFIDTSTALPEQLFDRCKTICKLNMFRGSDVTDGMRVSPWQHPR